MKRTGGWFVWSRTNDSGVVLTGSEYVGRHRGEGVGRAEQPRTGRHAPEYIAQHESTQAMQALGQAQRVRPEWSYQRDFE